MATTGLLTERHGAVALFTINREPQRNALDAATSAALDQKVDEAEADPAVAVLVLTGTGTRAFCSGMDLKEAAATGAGGGLVPDRGFGGITERRRRKPLIGAINGAAIAGGFELALACDLVVAADHAVFGLAEVRHGLFAFAGGIQRLARTVPRQTALALILTGAPLPAARLHQLGLVTEVVPGPDVLPRALALAALIAAHPRDAVRDGKLLYELATDTPIDASLRFGRAWGEAALAASDRWRQADRPGAAG